MERQLKRVRDHSRVAGICGGFAYWLGLPTWLLRLLMLILLFCYGIGLIPYIILWIVMPTWLADPLDYKRITSS